MLRREEAEVHRLLEMHRQELEAVAALLMERETVPGEAIRGILGRSAPDADAPVFDV